MIEKYCFRSRY